MTGIAPAYRKKMFTNCKLPSKGVLFTCKRSCYACNFAKPFADAIKKYPNDAAAIEYTYNVLKRGGERTGARYKQIK